jgi:hypothetical protein
LVNRTRAGKLQVFEDLAFHVGIGAPALEMREFSQCALQSMLHAAGFGEVRIHSEECAAYGIESGEGWSLPITARKGRFGLGRDAMRDLIEGSRALENRLRRSWWFRLGWKLGLV